MNKQKIQLDRIEDAIVDIKKGKLVIVVDDENRENEGDFIAASEKVTPEMINFMAHYGRGLICNALTEERCEQLKLDMMVEDNTVLHNTQFTVPVDLIGQGCTTGISAYDRAKTILALTDENTKPTDLGRPGHIFPLKAKKGGVLRRSGHTEAAIDLVRLANLKPSGILVEILNEDGTMARLPQLHKVAKKFDFKLISIEDLIAYRMRYDALVEKIEDFHIKTRFGEFRLRAYSQTTNHQIHIALTKGSWDKDTLVLTRINSNDFGNDILSILTENVDIELVKIFRLIEKENCGAVVFINQTDVKFNILEKLKRLNIQDANTRNIDLKNIIEKDEKDFGIGAQILHDLDIHNLNLISNSEVVKKRVGITGYGLKIIKQTNY